MLVDSEARVELLDGSTGRSSNKDRAKNATDFADPRRKLEKCETLVKIRVFLFVQDRSGALSSRSKSDARLILDFGTL